MNIRQPILQNQVYLELLYEIVRNQKEYEYEVEDKKQTIKGITATDLSKAIKKSQSILFRQLNFLAGHEGKKKASVFSSKKKADPVYMRDGVPFLNDTKIGQDNRVVFSINWSKFVDILIEKAYENQKAIEHTIEERIKHLADHIKMRENQIKAEEEKLKNNSIEKNPLANIKNNPFFLLDPEKTCDKNFRARIRDNRYLKQFFYTLLYGMKESKVPITPNLYLERFYTILLCSPYILLYPVDLLKGNIEANLNAEHKEELKKIEGNGEKEYVEAWHKAAKKETEMKYKILPSWFSDQEIKDLSELVQSLEWFKIGDPMFQAIGIAQSTEADLIDDWLPDEARKHIKFSEKDILSILLSPPTTERKIKR